MTVLLTTHYMDEADQLCDRLAMMHRGIKRAEGTPQALKAALGLEASLEDVFRHFAGDELGTKRSVVLGAGGLRGSRERRTTREPVGNHAAHLGTRWHALGPGITSRCRQRAGDPLRRGLHRLHRQLGGFPAGNATGNLADQGEAIGLQQTRGDG